MTVSGSFVFRRRWARVACVFACLVQGQADADSGTHVFLQQREQKELHPRMHRYFVVRGCVFEAACLLEGTFDMQMVTACCEYTLVLAASFERFVFVFLPRQSGPEKRFSLQFDEYQLPTIGSWGPLRVHFFPCFAFEQS